MLESPVNDLVHGAFSVSKTFDTLLKNASIFERNCSPLHAALGQGATQGHTGGLRGVFSDAHVPGKNVFRFIFPPPGGKSFGWRVLDALKIIGKAMAIIIGFSVILTLILFFFIKWLPEWQGRM